MTKHDNALETHRGLTLTRQNSSTLPTPHGRPSGESSSRMKPTRACQPAIASVRGGTSDPYHHPDPLSIGVATMTGVDRYYDCDCCGQRTPSVLISVCWAFGLETHACPACRGQEPEDWEHEAEAYERWRQS